MHMSINENSLPRIKAQNSLEIDFEFSRCFKLNRIMIAVIFSTDW